MREEGVGKLLIVLFGRFKVASPRLKVLRTCKGEEGVGKLLIVLKGGFKVASPRLKVLQEEVKKTYHYKTSKYNQTMKKFAFLLSILTITFSSYCQTTISGKTPAKDVKISTADYSNGIPVLSATAEFIEPSGNNLLDAEETAQIKITITNSGTNAAFDVEVNVTVDNNNNLSYNVSNKKFGQIDPNSTVTALINITANQNIQNSSRKFNINFTEYQGFIARPIAYEIQTQKLREPKLVFIETGIEEIGGNKNNFIEQGDLILATVLIQNQGQGTATNATYEFSGFTNALINTMTNDYPVSGSLGNIAPGESKTITFAFSATWNYTGADLLPLKIKLSESRGSYGGTYSLGLQMNVQQLSAVDMKQQGSYQQDVDIDIASLTSDIDKNIPQNAQNSNRFALIIGNEHYVANNGLAVDVPFAINDALIFKEYAVNTLGIPVMQVKYINDATSSTMKREIESFVNIMARNPNAEFFVYYAGHGYYDAQDDPYMMPVNVKHNEINDALKLNDFYAALTQNQTKGVTVFLDACFSGGGRGDDGLVAGRTGLRRPTNNADMEGNLVVFAASSGQQTSKPFNDQKHGIFTYFLLKKLQETSGNLNYDQLDQYLLQNVSTTADLLFSEEQTPTVKVSPDAQNTWKNWRF
ncbi:MAG: caspase family protein [Bacteroidales bacterium]|nr:caspase family protein [Bacteroidales bacterium]